MKKTFYKNILFYAFIAIIFLVIPILAAASCSTTTSDSSPMRTSPSPTLSASYIPSSSPTVSPYPDPQPILPQKKVIIGNTTIVAEIASNDQERQSGLSWRRSLGEYDGMLFVFETKTLGAMWMHGMLFPLDVIWICDDQVVDIMENVPNPPDPYSVNLPSYSPDKEFNYFLEVNAGFVKKHGIKVGDKMRIEEL